MIALKALIAAFKTFHEFEIMLKYSDNTNAKYSEKMKKRDRIKNIESEVKKLSIDLEKVHFVEIENPPVFKVGQKVAGLTITGISVEIIPMKTVTFTRFYQVFDGYKLVNLTENDLIKMQEGKK